MRYISQKTISGKTYYYLQYKNYCKNLGSFLPTNLQEELITFFGEIYEKEWGKIPAKIKEDFPEDGLKILETFHYFFILLGHELFGEKRKKFYEEFYKNFTFHSGRSAGVKMTKNEIEIFLQKNLKSPKLKIDQEIFNSYSAIQFSLSDEMKWNMKSIKNIHRLLFSKTDPLIAGKWRREAKGHPIEPENIPVNLKNLIIWLKSEFKKKPYPPTLALQFYIKFDQIKPFSSGNAQIARILFNVILKKFNYPPLIFFNENDPQFLVALRHAFEGRWKQMNSYYLLQVKKTADVLLRVVI